jgi:hypothetical protein
MRSKMFLALLLTCGMLAIVKAQFANDRLMAAASGNVAVLLSNKAIQEELKMTKEEVRKVRDWTKDFRDKANQIKRDKGFDIAKNADVIRIPLPSPEDVEKLAAADAEIKKVSYKELSDILKKTQIERLKQIDLQNMGIGAFTDDEVASALKLTDKQKTSMKGFSDDRKKANNDIMNEGRSGGNFLEKAQESQKKIQRVRKEYYDKAVAILTDEQKKNWKEMTGEPFDLEKLLFQFPKKKD